MTWTALANVTSTVEGSFRETELLFADEFPADILAIRHSAEESLSASTNQLQRLRGVWRAAPGEDDNYIYSIAL